MAVRSLVVTCLLTAARGVPESDLVKGISYGPAPCKSACQLPQDDFMAEAAKPMWGPRGRADLAVMRQLGANTVRLYGNNPENDHRGFLEEAHSLGLRVSVGISDWPYIQSPDNCLATTGLDCYQQIRESYLLNLQNGFLLPDKSYHPAVREVIVINEPDLKLGGDKQAVMKAVISAIDGMVDAEREAGVAGSLVNFTAAMSFAICGAACGPFGELPAVGQLDLFREAMLNPEGFGYTPRNDLATFYRTRWTNSFNTANPARDIRPQFLDPYEKAFPTTPVEILEFHHPGPWNQTMDMLEVLQIARSSPLLLGVAYFEFQVRRDKGGSEEAFGMFDLGMLNFQTMAYFGTDFNSWCLVPVEDAYGGGTLAQAVANAYGGSGPLYSELCTPDPTKVALDPAGFAQIAAQGSPARMARFVRRIVQHLGARIVDEEALVEFSAAYVQAANEDVNTASFGELLGSILGPSVAWASWPPHAACMADRLASADDVGKAVGWACSRMTSFNCSRVPQSCNRSVWELGDYVFGKYYQEQQGSPLANCYFNGSAIFSTVVLQRLTGEEARCLVPLAVPEQKQLALQATQATIAATTQATAATAPTPTQATTAAAAQAPAGATAQASTTGGAAPEPAEASTPKWGLGLTTEGSHFDRPPIGSELSLSTVSVDFAFTVESVNYAGLLANAHVLSGFGSRIRRVVSSAAGVGVMPEEVQLTLLAGSVRVGVSVGPLTESRAAAVVERIRSLSSLDGWAARIRAVENIGEVATGHITISAPTAPAIVSALDAAVAAAAVAAASATAAPPPPRAEEQPASDDGDELLLGSLAGVLLGAAGGVVLTLCLVAAAPRLRRLLVGKAPAAPSDGNRDLSDPAPAPPQHTLIEVPSPSKSASLPLPPRDSPRKASQGGSCYSASTGLPDLPCLLSSRAPAEFDEIANPIKL